MTLRYLLSLKLHKRDGIKSNIRCILFIWFCAALGRHLLYIRKSEVAQRYYVNKAIPKSYSNVRESLLSALHEEIGCNRAHPDNSFWIEKDELSLQEGTFDAM